MTESNLAGTGKDGLPVIPFATAAAWEAWLETNHDTAPGLWIRYARKESGLATVTYVEAVEVALCFGWIDGQVGRAAAGDWWIQRFVPRRARSKWSKINCGRAERLTREDRMRPAGLAEVAAAKADGRWDAAYHSPRAMVVPDDLRAALDADPKAAAFFATLKSQNRYAILYRVADAKRAETRARRIAQFVAMLARGETLY